MNRAIRMMDEISPMGNGLISAGHSVTLKNANPRTRAIVEFKDEAEAVVSPSDVPSWVEDSDGQVISLLVAADGLSATVIPKGVGKANLTVTTIGQGGARVQVHDMVSVVDGEPTHALIHWNHADVQGRAPVSLLEQSAFQVPTGSRDQSATEIDQDRAESFSALRSHFPRRKHVPRLSLHKRHHRLRYVALGLAALVLVGVGYVFLSYQFRSLPGAKSFSSVVNTFRGGNNTTNDNVLYQPPAQGVYELRGQGSERISFPPNSMSDGVIMPATVTYIGRGCWRWHLDYNTAHWEEYDFCPIGNQVVQSAYRNFQSWDFGTMTIKNLADFTCPSDSVVVAQNPRVGQTLRWTCNGTNTSVSGKTTQKVTTPVLGIVNLLIGKTTVKAVHEVEKVTLSGVQKGTALENWWFSATSSLPLRVERQITILTASPLGTITYTESGSWQMVSLAPRT